MTADPWQVSVADDVLAYRADGLWASTRVGLSVPRQNGKNAVLEIIELYKLVALGRAILHTAHEIKTAKKAFLRLAGFFEDSRNYPELARMAKHVRRTNGQEAIYLHHVACPQTDGPGCKCAGGSIEFIARSKSSGRGFTVDDLVMDEAQELSELAYAALLPTVAASPSGNPQQIICGTPPGPRDDGEVFERLRLDALGGKSQRTTWLEWSFEKGADPDDPGELARANPALGVRLSMDVIRDERASFDDVTFRRERGGVWASEDSSSGPIDARSWAVNLDPSSEPVGRLALAVDVAPDGSSAAVAVAGAREDGRWHVELIEQRTGTDWVPARVDEVVSRHGFGAVVVDGASQAFGLVEPLRERKVNVTVASARDMGAACALFFSATMEGTLHHLGQPQLSVAVSHGRRRNIGTEGLWGWGRASSLSDISPLVAATLAVWGATQTSVKVRQKRRRTGATYARG